MIELLPFLLNDSLDEGEGAAVREHLAGCGTCQAELRDAAFVWAATGSHPPSEVVADYGLGLDVSDFPRDLLEQHFETCSECQQALRILAANTTESSAQQAQSPTPEGPAPGTIGLDGWRMLAIAAGLLVAVLGSVVLWQFSGSSSIETDVTIAELMSVDARFRGTDRQTQTLIRSAQSALVLVPPKTPMGSDFRLTVLNPAGDREFGVDGLKLSDSGDFAVLLRTLSLRPGTYRLVLDERVPNVEPGLPGDWVLLGVYELTLGD